MRRPGLTLALARAGALAPTRLLRAGLTEALAGFDAALCLHRVGPSRPGAWAPELTMPARTIDAIVEELLASRPRARRRWLSVTFDDGYEDAAEYVDSRAARFPEVEFILFVCPEKAERRVGFRWDLAEVAHRAGAPRGTAGRRLDDPLDVETENEREPLRTVQERPEFRLATVEQLRSLGARTNVRIGNHTNCHFPAAGLPEEAVRAEFRRSFHDFRRLFGPAVEFAFPFGIPGEHFDVRHVGMLREEGARACWTTEARPFSCGARRPGVVLPRFPLLGSWSPRVAAAWITARAGLYRLRGTPHTFEPP